MKFFAVMFFMMSCSTQSAVPVPASDSVIIPEKPSGKLSTWNCESLIEKAKDITFSLKGLASLVAKKRCPDFTFDVKTLTAIEKRFYAEQIDELDPYLPPPNSSLTLDDWKIKLIAVRTPPEKMKAYKQLRIKQKNAGKRNDYIKTSKAMYTWAKKQLRKKKTTENQAYFYEAAQLFARTYWTEDTISKAHDILTEALTLLKDVSVAEIYFIQARMADEKLDMEKAVSLYDKAAADVTEFKPKTITFSVDRILWLKSWILFKEKKWSEAEKSLQTLAETTIDISEKSRANFYRARALNYQNKKDEAKIVLEEIIQSDFFGFYGLVAYHELGRKMPALSKVKFEKLFPFDLEISFLQPEQKTIFQDLIKYAETDIAEKSVLFLSKTPEQQINLGLYLAKNGNRYLPLFAAFGKLDNNARIEVLLSYSDLMYPQPHIQQVKTMAEKTSVSPSLIYSIMKKESAFNEKTRSSADACGLMQMIPRLAKQLSKKFEIPYSSEVDLFIPEINIQLGTFELMEQVKKQSGQLTFVAAAYNAGPSALNGWLKSRYRPDMLEFIEEIPYEETRTYVKLIARNKLFYDRISKRDEDHPFPIEFLEMIDSNKDSSARNL